MGVWDAYGDWDAIAQLPKTSEVRDYITGYKRQWRPNFVSPAIEYIFDYLIKERLAQLGPVPEKRSGLRQLIHKVGLTQATEPYAPVTALDFGCGLGRNAPMLRRYFSRVIAVDLPEMIDRLKTEGGDRLYDAVFKSAKDAVTDEVPSVVYDSVVLQHHIDRDFVASIVDDLNGVPTLKTLVSIHNDAPYMHLEVLKEKGWSVWHHEVETLSFEGYAHGITVLRRW